MAANRRASHPSRITTSSPKHQLFASCHLQGQRAVQPPQGRKSSDSSFSNGAAAFRIESFTSRPSQHGQPVMSGCPPWPAQRRKAPCSIAHRKEGGRSKTGLKLNGGRCPYPGITQETSWIQGHHAKWRCCSWSPFKTPKKMDTVKKAQICSAKPLKQLSTQRSRTRAGAARARQGGNASPCRPCQNARKKAAYLQSGVTQ